MKDPRAEKPYLTNNNVGMVRRHKKTLRTALYTLRWPFDDHSIGPGPPTEVLVSNLSSLITSTELAMHFRSYGDIEKLELKVDPSTGASLGLCSIRYRESKSDKSHAHECAKRAVKEGNGSKIGMNEMKVEFDRDGQVCKKIMGHLLAEKRKAQEVLQRKAMMVRHQVQNRDSRFRDRDDWSTFGHSPEPRLDARSPHGRSLTPGHKSDMRSPSREDNRASPLPQRDGWVPNALDRIQQEPYILIPASAIPPEEKFIPHLKGKLKKYDWTRIYVDRYGFYIIFKDGKEADRCYRQSKEDTFFAFIMVMHFFPLGNPNHSSEDQGRCKVPEIKKYRQVDIVAEVTDGLMKEMSLALMKDIKRRIAAPAFYDFLNPTQFRKAPEKGGSLESAPTTKYDDKFKLGIPIKEHKPSTAPKPTASRAAVKLTTLPRFKKRVVVTSSSGLTASLALNDSGKKLVKTDARPLHHQLNNYYSDVGSDDESSTLDQRPVSRGFSTADDDSMVTTPQAGSVVIGKRKRSGQGSSRLRDTPFSSEDEDEKKDSDRKPIDDDDIVSVADAVMPNTNDLDEIDAFLLGSQTKEESKTSSAAKKRLRELDFTSSEDESDNERIGKGDVMPKAKQEVKNRTVLDGLPGDEDVVMSGTQLDKRPVKLAKKAAGKVGRQPKQLAAKIVAKEKKPQSSTKKGRVTELLQWAIPTPGESRPTVIDDFNIILDLDGWQDLVKDDEDFECLRIALEGTKKADIGNTVVWAYNQKEVKASKNEGLRGIFLPSSY